MKFMKIAVAAALAFAWSNAMAFHSGGVAECEGCHSMHNSFEGSANVTGRALGAGSGPFLLKAQDQSGACLNCHGVDTQATGGNGYHIATSDVNPLDATTPVDVTPGGDFAWLKKTMTGSLRKALTTWEGDRHGHNIVAADFGYTADAKLTQAPGGTYPAASLACSSCHDPHGRYRRLADGSKVTTGLPIFNSGSYTDTAKYPAPIAGVSAVGVYRLLAGIGYQPKSLSGSYAFGAASPDAVAPSTFNANTFIDNSVVNTMAGKWDRVAYGQGMSEWCANCHTAMHNDAYTSGTAGQVHPAGNGAKLTGAIVTNYATYVSSGIMTGTGAGYSALAPFEVGGTFDNAGYVALKAFQATPTAPTTAQNVLCLSCHRAHASAFESMARYYLGNEFMTVADAGNLGAFDTSTTENKINTAYNAQQQLIAYNSRPATLFGPYARDYCNKCHAKD
jgi:hypothetical protein